MKESKKVFLIVCIFSIIGLISAISNNFQTDFNFYKSKLVINQNNVSETLYYKTDQNYHTLYRNFESPIIVNEKDSLEEFIKINKVKCEEGSAYVTDYKNFCYNESLNLGKCMSYTETNEYGCGFGNEYGFKKAQEYFIKAEYQIKPPVLYKIKGKYYLKFEVYSKNNHKYLVKDKNFFVEGNVVMKNKYLPSEDVIIYVPYDLNNFKDFNIVEREYFMYDSSIFKIFISIFKIFISIIFALLIPFLFFICWFFYGREKSYLDVPSKLSQYPKKRKAWEVACYFRAPFGRVDNGFFSSMMLSFYVKKIIDVKMNKKNPFIKITKNKDKINKLDNVEKIFFEMLNGLEKLAKQKHFNEDYFDLNKVSSTYRANSFLRESFRKIDKEIQKESKEYLEKKGFNLFVILGFISLFISFPIIGFLNNIILLPFMFFSFIFLIGFSLSSTLLIRFKKNYYQEYQQWNSFKKWLSDSNSMRTIGHRGAILWEEYLVYATSLGVAKKVLKELKKQGLIDENHYNTYIGINIASQSIGTSSGASGSGGSGGGAGGGGAGGGGGGGR